MKISAVSNQNYTINSNSNANSCRKSPNFGQFHATESLIKEFAASGIPAESLAKFKQLDTKSLSRKILDYRLSKDIKDFAKLLTEQVNSKLSYYKFSDKEKLDVLKSKEITDFKTKFSDEYKYDIDKIFTDNGSDFDIYVNRVDYTENSKNYLRAFVPEIGGTMIKMQDFEDIKFKMEQIIPTLETMTKEDYIIDIGNSATTVQGNDSPVVQNMFRANQIKRAFLIDQLNNILNPIINKKAEEREAELNPYRYLM